MDTALARQASEAERFAPVQNIFGYAEVEPKKHRRCRQTAAICCEEGRMGGCGWNDSSSRGEGLGLWRSIALEKGVGGKRKWESAGDDGLCGQGYIEERLVGRVLDYEDMDG